MGFTEARDSITVRELRAHLFLLSSAQRQAHSPASGSGEIQAEYIASSFIGLGLRPVGDSYFQNVPLVGVTLDPTTVALAAEVGDRRIAAAIPSDAVLSGGSASPAVHVTGDLVFVGYGIDSERWSWDDFKDRDLRGKVLLFLVGDPPASPDEPELFNGRATTRYGRWRYKLEEAARRGATGALLIHRPEFSGYEWSVVREGWGGEQLLLEEGEDEPALLLQGWVTSDFARRALEAAHLDLDELTVRAARRDFRPLDTGITIRSRMNSRSRAVEARTVMGVMPGATDEVVILTARYGPPEAGEGQAAIGASILLEIADAFSRLDRPRRGLLFIATPGEPQGLLASRHYLRKPAFPLGRTIAAIQLDGAEVGAPGDVTAARSEATLLVDILGARAAELGVPIRPAPRALPFLGTDPFLFAGAGIPPLHLSMGGEFGVKTADSSLRGEEPDESLLGAVQQARLVFSIAYDIAHAEQRLTWRGGSASGGTPSERAGGSRR